VGFLLPEGAACGVIVQLVRPDLVHADYSTPHDRGIWWPQNHPMGLLMLRSFR
jgi:hypothetical protein